MSLYGDVGEETVLSMLPLPRVGRADKWKRERMVRPGKREKDRHGATPLWILTIYATEVMKGMDTQVK